MLGIRFLKVQPTDYVLHYKKGRLVREGAGQSFFYFAPTSSLVLVPMASVEVPFMFEEVTADFQEVTIQGGITYRVSDAKRLAALMNFTLAPGGRDYASEDPERLPQRLISLAQVLVRSALKSLALRDALGASDGLIASLRAGLQKAEAVSSLGIEVLGLSILAVRPKPETARALEAGVRERMLKEADEAVYARRNAAVEQERAIKENELNTEIAVETKKRQIRETQMEAEKSIQAKKRELGEAEMATKVSLEEKRKTLVALAAENAKREADAKAYGLSAVVKPLAEVDPKVVAALANAGMDPGQLLAAAFQSLAEKADKIGQLNVSPDLLREILRQRAEK